MKWSGVAGPALSGPAPLVTTAIALAAVVGGSAWWTTSRMEGNLTEQANQAVAAAGLPVTVRYDGRDAWVSAVPPGAPPPAQALAVVKGIDGTRVVHSVVGAAGTTPDPGNNQTPQVSQQHPGAPTPSAPATKSSRQPHQLTVHFPYGTWELSSSAQNQIAVLAHDLTSRPPTSIQIQGHTDTTGTEANNMSLSRRRAEVVAQVLTANGVPADRIRTEGLGDTQPAASNKRSTGQALNRRAVVMVKENK